MKLVRKLKKLDLFASEPANAFTISNSYSGCKETREYKDSYKSWSGVILSLITIFTVLVYGFNSIKLLSSTSQIITEVHD